MPSAPGVERKSRGTATDAVLLQTRVDREVRDHAREMALAAGITMNRLLEYVLMSQELDSNGRPICVPDSVGRRDHPQLDYSDSEELPLQNAS